ncbi:MAG: GNAT family N-acetyltransferase [Chitinophagaceae bacterium]
MQQVLIRNIEKQDNPIIAKIIRTTLEEFKANHPGTVYFDASTDALYELFQTDKSNYQVALLNGELVGGGGIFPTASLPPDTCELVKMYLHQNARGTGIGKILIEKAIASAKAMGFKKIYLETMPELKLALNIYAKFGFTYLTAPMGNSGHGGCTLWMMKNIE